MGEEALDATLKVAVKGAVEEVVVAAVEVVVEAAVGGLE